MTFAGGTTRQAQLDKNEKTSAPIANPQEANAVARQNRRKLRFCDSFAAEGWHWTAFRTARYLSSRNFFALNTLGRQFQRERLLPPRDLRSIMKATL
jgi:hypothetical protein